MNTTLHSKILLVALMHLFVIVCQAQAKDTPAVAKGINEKIVVNQMLPDTLTVKSISMQQEKVKWELYVGAFAVLLIGFVTAGVSYLNVNNTIKTSHATTLALTKAQFLQNNTRVWLQDIIESTAKFLNDVAMLSTDTRYHSCINHQVKLSMLEKDYKPMSENKRLELTKTVDLELSKLMFLLSDDSSTDEGQIVTSLRFLFGDAQNKEIANSPAADWNKFQSEREKVVTLTQKLLAKYREKVFESALK